MKKNLKILAVLLLLISIPLYLTQVFDSAVEPMRKYISADSEITEKVGKVDSIRIKKSTYVNKSENSPKHRLYMIRVSGSAGELWVKMKAIQDTDNGMWKFNVVSMNE